jgi:hypothetical protein
MKQAASTFLTLTLLATLACQDNGTPTSTSDTATLANAFATLPLGFADVQSTFADRSSSEWTPDGESRGGHRGQGEQGMMCGGLGGLAGAGLGLGLGHDRLGELPGTCTYDAASGRVNCEPESRDGLTITRSAAYSDASGAAQAEFDSLTTNTVNVQIEVTGSKSRRDGNTTTVQHTSDRTVTGLAQGSSRRTINGSSAGNETTTGTDSVGTFNAVRIIGDTVQDVVIHASSNQPTYPTAGTIIRSMQVSATYQGQSPTTISRREVVRFDGSNTALVEVTENGKTRNCSLALPSGRLTCS